MTLGERIANLRKDMGYSQEYVAEQLDVSRQAVSKWETDLSSPDTENLIKLAEILNTSVQFLATGKDFYFPEGRPAPENKIKIKRKHISIAISVFFGAIILFLISAYVLTGLFSTIDFDRKRYYKEDRAVNYETFIEVKYHDELSELILEELDIEGFTVSGISFVSLSYSNIYNKRETIFHGACFLSSAAGNNYTLDIKVTGKRIWYNTYEWSELEIKNLESCP